jgi:hypothetical protein
MLDACWWLEVSGRVLEGLGLFPKTISSRCHPATAPLNSGNITVEARKGKTLFTVPDSSIREITLSTVMTM